MDAREAPAERRESKLAKLSPPRQASPWSMCPEHCFKGKKQERYHTKGVLVPPDFLVRNS